MPNLSVPSDVTAVVQAALKEDLGSGDLTAALIDVDATAKAQVISREAAVLCGQPWFEETFKLLDASVSIRWRVGEGAILAENAIICELEGSARALLTGERTALNFLQLLSGTATTTRRFVDLVAGTGARILDTRKTVPGLRLAQKYAVRCGGGHNHRIGLYDAVLIKENHIAAAGSLARAVREARRSAPAVMIEVEVETLAQLAEALDTEADRVMLDNFSITDLRAAVTQRDAREGKRPELEASGGIDATTLRATAETGVDFISLGTITKNVRAIDLSMRFC